MDNSRNNSIFHVMDKIIPILDTIVYYNPVTNFQQKEAHFKITEYNLCVDKEEDLPKLQEFFSTLDLKEIEKERRRLRIEKLLYKDERQNDYTPELQAFLKKHSLRPLLCSGVEEYLDKEFFPYILGALNTGDYYNLSTKFYNSNLSKNADFSRCITYRYAREEPLYLVLRELIEKRKNLLDQLELNEREEILEKAWQVKEGYFLDLFIHPGYSSVVNGKLVRREEKLHRFIKDDDYGLPQLIKGDEYDCKKLRKYKLRLSSFPEPFVTWYKQAWKKRKNSGKEVTTENDYEWHITQCYNRKHCFNLSTGNFNLPSTRGIERSRFFSYSHVKDKPLYDTLVKSTEEKKAYYEAEEQKFALALFERSRKVKDGFYLEVTLPGGPILLEEILEIGKNGINISTLPLTKDLPEEVKKYKLALSQFSNSFQTWFKEQLGEKNSGFTKEKEIEDYLCSILEIKKDSISAGRQVPLGNGRADIIYFDLVIELKRSSRWREAIAQLQEYSSNLEGSSRVLVLFGETSNRKVQEKICKENGIHLLYFTEIYKELEKETNKKNKLINLLSPRE